MQATRQASVPVEDDDGLVLPWWYSWWRVALITIAATLAAAGGFAMLAKAHQPGAGSVDAGFLRHKSGLERRFSFCTPDAQQKASL